MRIIIKFLIFLFVGSVIGCNEADEVEETNQIYPELKLPNEIIYFTYRPNPYHDTSEKDNWLIIHNQSGKLIDYRAYEKEDTLVFKALDTTLVTTENLVITTLTINQLDNKTNHNLETYTNIPKGQDWSFGKHSNLQLENHLNTHEDQNGDELATKISLKSKSLSITVRNVPGIKKYNINGGSVVAANYNPIYSDELLLENIVLLPNFDYIFFIGDMEEDMKYLFFRVDETTTYLDFDYNDFRKFDTVIETSMPENSYLFSVSTGYKTSGEFGSKFEMTVELDFHSPEISRIGYVSGFDYYTTYFQLTMNSGYQYFHYEKSQTPLQTIDILEKPSFSVNDKSVYNFSFNTDIDFIRTKSYWRYDGKRSN